MDLKVAGNNNTSADRHIAKHEPAHVKIKKAEIQPAQDKSVPADKEPLKELQKIIGNMRINSKVQMFYDKEMDRVVVQVLDGQSQALIRQIPEEDYVSFVKKFRQYIGTTINRRV